MVYGISANIIYTSLIFVSRVVKLFLIIVAIKQKFHKLHNMIMEDHMEKGGTQYTNSLMLVNCIWCQF
jgi:hypothetical protein